MFCVYYCYYSIIFGRCGYICLVFINDKEASFKINSFTCFFAKYIYIINKNVRVNFFIKLTQEIKKCRVYKEDTLYKKISKIK